VARRAFTGFAAARRGIALGEAGVPGESASGCEEHRGKQGDNGLIHGSLRGRPESVARHPLGLDLGDGQKFFMSVIP
jgi:hypothetical protein